MIGYKEHFHDHVHVHLHAKGLQVATSQAFASQAHHPARTGYAMAFVREAISLHHTTLVGNLLKVTVCLLRRTITSMYVKAVITCL